MTRRFIVLIASHLLCAGLGFALGIYVLPILTAPGSPPPQAVSQAMKEAIHHATFERSLKGSDRLHWAQGRVSVGKQQIAFDGRMAPGPDYKVYLTDRFVDNAKDFQAVKQDAVRVGEVKTFDRFIIDLPAGVDTDKHTTVVVWCERFSKFISAAQYRPTP